MQHDHGSRKRKPPQTARRAYTSVYADCYREGRFDRAMLALAFQRYYPAVPMPAPDALVRAAGGPAANG